MDAQIITAIVESAKVVVEKIVDEVDKQKLLHYIEQLEQAVINRDSHIRDFIKEIGELRETISKIKGGTK